LQYIYRVILNRINARIQQQQIPVINRWLHTITQRLKLLIRQASHPPRQLFFPITTPELLFLQALIF
jgi:hypothetical protein